MGQESKMQTLDPKTIKEASEHLFCLNLKGGNGKLFLMALLIANHPNEIFEEPRDEDECSLIKRAKDFSLLLSQNQQNSPPPEKEWNLFLQEMRNWRKGTIGGVENEVKESYKNLSEIENKLPKENEAVMKEWMPHIQKEKGKLTSLMRRMSGSDKMIEMVNESKIVNDEVKNSVKELDLPTEMLSNSSIIHELVLNPKLNFDQIRKMLNGNLAFSGGRNGAKNYQEQQEDQDGALVDLDLINSSPLAKVEYVLYLKDKLYSIVRNSDLLKRVEEWLGEDVLKEQLKVFGVDWKMENSLEILLDAMAESCAPIRDVEVEAIREANNLKEFLEGMHKLLVGMTSDMANFQLLLLRRQLAKVVVEYEKKFFLKEYEKKRDEFSRSKDVYNVIKNAGNQEHLEGIVNLILNGPIQDYLPLSLDQERISTFRDRLTLSIKGSCIMLFMKGFSTSISEDDLHRRISILLQCPNNEVNLSNVIQECICYIKNKEDKEKINNGLGRIWEQKDPMVSLLRKRLDKAVLGSIRENLENASNNKKGSINKDHISKTGINSFFFSTILEGVDEITKMISLHLQVQEGIFYSK